MLDQLRALATALVTSLNPTENAPKWGAALGSLVGTTLASIDLALPGAATAGLGVFFGALIGKAVQRWFTQPRQTRTARRRARAARRAERRR